ncbi:MAG TPA: ABC transporter permease, partial [Vicinamibacterales bacterium]|nr:ABC transporter permease [Vicinamibacterales bacterium]
MTVLRRLASIASWILRRDRIEQQLDDEIRSFVEMSTADRIREGVSPTEARRLALAEIGGVESMKEIVRAGRHGALLDDLGRDVRYAFRLLARQRMFAVVIVGTLALGIGANVALFSVVNSVLLRPLPYHEPDRLVRLASTDHANNLTRIGFSYSRFLEVQQRQEVFSDLALSAGNAFTLIGRGVPEQVIGLQASATLLPTLGLQPIIGRNFSPDEDRRGGPRVVLISRQMWRQRFNGDVSVLGQALTLDGAPYTITGVLPDAATAFLLNHQQIWVPRPSEVPLAQSQLQGGSYFFRPIARLKPGVSLEQAREAMNVIAAGYRAAHPENLDALSAIELVPLLDDAVGAQRESYLLLLGAVACVLLIACANIANLLLARFAGRQREIATRLALGARRGALVRQLVSESMLLAVLGGGGGLLLAEWTLRALVAFGTDVIPRLAEIRIDSLALGFAVIATLVTGLSIGLLPAMQASGVNVLNALKAAGPGSVGSGRYLRGGLVVVEVSLSLVLLITTGLLLTSFERLQRVDPGFEPQGVFTAQIALPPRYSRAKLIEFYEQFYQRLATLPGASSAALSDRVPLSGNQGPTVVAVAGRPIPPLSERPYANRHLVSPHYFSTLRIPLRAGRDFDERDNPRVPQVVIINETFARRLFPGEDPVGHTLVTGMAQQQAQVVGVVADIRSESLNTPPEPGYFLPALQRPETLTNVLVRSNLTPAAVAPLVREALRTIDPDLPLLQPEALTARIGQAVANRKLGLVLLGGFAVLALVLASLGVYSVMAHVVACRTSEIGLRMALGAPPGAVMRMVLGHGRRLTLLGIAFGIAGALVVSRL